MVSWDALEAACHSCTLCALSEHRKNVVFGSGNRNADVMFIGEGPGEQEDNTGLPFVGRAGQLLDDMLAIIGLHRDKVYIANIVKCRPPGNRDPLEIEAEACLPWVRRQTALVQPRVIVCLGRIAATRIIHADFKITKEHGLVFPRGKYQLMAMYHPAFLLRDPRRRPEAFDDLRVLAALLEKPIDAAAHYPA